MPCQINKYIPETIQGHKYFDRKCFMIPKKDIFALLLRGYPIFLSAIVVRKQIFDLIGMWRKALRNNEDFDFGLRGCRVTNFIYIDEKLAMIGRHGANKSGDIQLQAEGDIPVIDLHMTDPSYNKEEKDLIKYHKGGRLCGLGYNYLKSGNNKQAVRKYSEALRYRKWFWHALLKQNPT